MGTDGAMPSGSIELVKAALESAGVEGEAQRGVLRDAESDHRFYGMEEKVIAEGRAAYIVRQLLDAGFRMGAGAVLTIEGALARYFMSPKPVEDGSLEQRQMLGLYLSVLAGNGLCGREIALGSPHRWMLKLEREELVDLRAIFTALGDVPDFSITITGVETTSERISVTATRNGDGVVLGSPNFPVEALDELLEGLAVYVDGLANN